MRTILTVMVAASCGCATPSGSSDCQIRPADQAYMQQMMLQEVNSQTLRNSLLLNAMQTMSPPAPVYIPQP